MILNETVYGKPILEEVSRDKLPKGVLCRVSYPICDIGKRNANGRVYEDAVWEGVHGDTSIQSKIESRGLFGHAEHPDQTQSNLEKISHVIFEMWRDGDQEWQKFDVFDTPTGRIVDCLLKSCPVGCSTRAEGDLEEAEDSEGKYQRVIPESYRYVTTDFTADPSTAGSIPHDIKRNIVSEAKKIFKDKHSNGGEMEFAEKVLESMQCKKCKETKEVTIKSAGCKGCGCCEALEERKISAKKAKELPRGSVYKCEGGCGSVFDDPSDINTSKLCKKCAKTMKEKKTVSILIKEGILEEGAVVQYDDKDARVKIEEGKVTLLIGDVDPTTVAVDGNASVSVSPEGLITVLSAEAMEAMSPQDVAPEVGLEVEAPVEDLPVEDLPVEDLPVEDEPELEPELDDTDKDIVPESKGLPATGSPHIQDKFWYDSRGTQWKVTDSTSDLLTIKSETGKIKKINLQDFIANYSRSIGESRLTTENLFNCLGKVVKIQEGEHKDKEGKLTEIREGAIGITLDDGTVVNIEDPAAINITVTSPPEEEIAAVPEEEFPGTTEEEAEELHVEADEELPESKTDERQLEKDPHVVAVREKDGGWEVFLTGDGKGKDRFLTRFDEKDEAIKRAEKVAGETGVDYKGVVESQVNEEFEDFDEKPIELGDTVQIMDLAGNTTPVPEATVHEIDQDTEGNLAVEVTGSEDEDKRQWYGENEYQIVLLKKANESVNEMAVPGNTYHPKGVNHKDMDVEVIHIGLNDQTGEALVTVKELDSGNKDDYSGKEFLAKFELAVGSFGIGKKRSDESISTTVKEIKDLRIQEASTRVERDKAIQLLEELTDGKQQFESKIAKDKALEIKLLVTRIGKTLEAKEREVNALRSKLEEKAKLAADQKKLVSEARATSLKGVTSLTEAVAVEAKVMKDGWVKSNEGYEKKLKQVAAALLLSEKNFKEGLEFARKQTTEDVTKDVTAKVTEQFIKSFVEFRLSESNLKVDENSRALLEKSTSLEDVDNFLDDIVDASRRSALHSEAIREIRVPKHAVPDPEGDRIKRSVGNIFEGINGK